MGDRRQRLKEAASRLRALQADLAPADAPALTAALGDSPTEDDLAIIQVGLRLHDSS